MLHNLYVQALVTGGAGFIGSHVVDALLAKGARIRVLDDFSTGKLENLDGLRGDLDVIEKSFLEGDVANRAADGCDAIFHLAAVASVQRSIDDPLATGRVNAEGTALIAQVAARAGAKLIFSSSSAVYGNAGSEPVKESDLPCTLSPYAAQKLSGEAYLQSFHASFGLKSVSLRYFNVYGPKQDSNSEYAAVVPNFLTRAIKGDPLVIFGDGCQTRDFVFVGDVARANLLAFESKVEEGGPINIGSGGRTSILDLAKIAIEHVGSSSQIEFRPARAGEIRHSGCDIRRASELLGFRAEVSLGAGLEQTADFWGRRVAA